MTLVETATIVDLQSAKAFSEIADGDEPHRQRLVALAIAEAEYKLNPDDKKRMTAVRDLRVALHDYIVDPLAHPDAVAIDPNVSLRLGQIAS